MIFNFNKTASRFIISVIAIFTGYTMIVSFAVVFAYFIFNKLTNTVATKQQQTTEQNLKSTVFTKNLKSGQFLKF